METLFRFMVVRSAQEATEKKRTVPLSRNTKMQLGLKNALSAESPHEKSREILKSFVESEKYINVPNKLKYYGEIDQFRKRLEENPVVSLVALEALLSDCFAASASMMVKDVRFNDDWNNLADSIIAIKLLPEENRQPILQLVRAFRAMHLIGLIAGKDLGEDIADATKNILSAVLILPEKYSTALRRRPEIEISAKMRGKKEQYRMYEEALKRSNDLESAIQELTTLRAKDLVRKSDEKLSLESPPPKRSKKTRKPETKDAATIRNEPRISAIVIKPDTVSSLSNTTKEVLKTELISADKTDYNDMLFLLDKKLSESLEMLSVNEPAHEMEIVGMVGQKLIFQRKDPVYQRKDLETEVEIAGGARAAVEEHYRKPGNIKPMGVGDLLILEQQLIRYEGGDIAHIENILKSEKKDRIHRKLNRSEQYVLAETETSKEEERDLQSTDRFEMQKETETTIQEQSNLDVGLNISASYGPVSVSANFGYQREKAKQEGTKTATEYAREVTSKSIKKISEKIREQLSTRIFEEIEETNTHGFNNTEGTGHIIGVYQWVNKIYETQIYKYGLREMYDLIIPEPGAFLMKALSPEVSEQIGLEEPRKFTKRPRSLTLRDVDKYIRRYDITGLEPPPESHKTVAMTFYKRQGDEGEGGTSTGSKFTEAMELEIPTGYKATTASMHINFAHEDYIDRDNIGDVYVRGTIGVDRGFTYRAGKYLLFDVHPFSHSADAEQVWSGRFEQTFEFTLRDQTDFVPVTVLALAVSDCVVSVEIQCTRTADHYKEWKYKTHSAIMQAYLNKKAAFEEKLAAYAINQGVQITGRNPIINREIEKNQLRKCCLALIMGEHFEHLDSIDKFGAIEEDPDNELPRINLASTGEQEKFIRFLEHAFEWNNLTFTLYPYFWSRKENWREKIRFEDVDKKFADFMSAGAARVVVPARLGFENAIRHFIATGEPWEGGDLPSIEEDEFYLPIIQEMQEQLGIGEEKTKYGGPEQITVPTNLVRLRPNDCLPAWRYDETEDNWVPDDSTECDG